MARHVFLPETGGLPGFPEAASKLLLGGHHGGVRLLYVRKSNAVRQELYFTVPPQAGPGSGYGW
jgi:hypothetical protein